VDVVGFFRVDDRDDHLAKKTERHEPLLTIDQAIVFVRVGHAVKHLFRVDKIESVLPEIDPPLLLIPGDHRLSVYTYRIFVKCLFPEDLLLIEVADSLLQYDQAVKLPLYARAGVREAWLVDLVRNEVQVHREPMPGGFGFVERRGRGSHVEPLAFPRLALRVDELLG
jgi:hypothetical protein